jgi:sec-independent protein translocase protein TatA
MSYTTNDCLAMFGLPGGAEWIVIALIGLLIFGRRLPEVGRGLGKSIVEFKKGLKGIEDEIENASDDPDMLPPPDTTAENTAEPKPTGESVSQSNSHAS